MKQTLSFLLLLITGSLSLAQPPLVEWQKLLGGTQLDNASKSIETSDSGYILIGVTNSNDGDVSGNHGGSDMWIAKLSSTREIQWTKSLGGSSTDIGLDIIQTSDEGYIVMGSTASNDGNIALNHGNSDIWVVKLGITGEIQWQKTIGGSQYDIGNCLFLLDDGGFMLFGNTQSVDGDVSFNHGATDYFMARLDVSGNILWQKTFGGSNEDFLTHATKSSDGGYLLTGFTYSDDGDITENKGAIDAWFLKTDSDGNIELQKTFGGTDEDYFYGAAQTSAGEFILAGQTLSNDGDVTQTLGDYDAWVVKATAEGQILWQGSFGGTGSDDASFVLINNDDSMIFAGSSTSNDGNVSGNHGNYDAWLFKLDVQGNFVWQETIGGNLSEGINSFDRSPDGGILVSGPTSSNNDAFSENHGDLDLWLFKLEGEALGDAEFSSGSVMLYPNPSSSKISISSGGAFIDEIEVNDLTGKTVIRQSGYYGPVDISALSSGMYIARFKTGSMLSYQKFIKK